MSKRCKSTETAASRFLTLDLSRHLVGTVGCETALPSNFLKDCTCALAPSTTRTLPAAMRLTCWPVVLPQMLVLLQLLLSASAVPLPPLVHTDVCWECRKPWWWTGCQMGRKAWERRLDLCPCSAFLQLRRLSSKSTTGWKRPQRLQYL